MMKNQTAEPFELVSRLQPTGHATIDRFLCRRLSHSLGLNRLEATYRACGDSRGSLEFTRNLLQHLEVRYQVHHECETNDLLHGPVIVVANHPFGGIDAIIMANLLKGLRDDVRILANSLLQGFPQLDDLIIGVDPFSGPGASRRNLAPLREAVRWLRSGGLLMTFPAGEVSHLRPGHSQVQDPQWDPSLARLIELSGATVVPAFFDGYNSHGFQMLGLLHPRLRTALLVRELNNKRGRTIRLAFGTGIDAEVLRGIRKPAEIVRYLRNRTYALKSLCRSRPPRRLIRRKPDRDPQVPVISPVSVALLKREISALPAECCLAGHGPFKV